MLGKNGDPTFCAQGFRNYIEQGYRRMLSSQDIQPDSRRPPMDLTVGYLLNAGFGAIVCGWKAIRQRCPDRWQFGSTN